MLKNLFFWVGLKVDEFRLWLAGLILPKMVKNATGHYNDIECGLVREMFDKFGFTHRDVSPGPMPEWQLRQRVECMWEELREFLVAAGVAIEYDQESMDWRCVIINPSQDVPQMADALVDLTYFVKGTAVAMGLPWGHLFDDVHECNMRKVLGTTKRGHSVDLAKPPGWEPPNTAAILQEHGWEPSTLNDIGK